MLLKNYVEPEIVAHHLFKEIINSACMDVAILNDLLSLKKEADNGETGNLVLIKYETSSRPDLELPIKSVYTDININLLAIRTYCTQLSEIFPNNRNLETMISHIFNALTGHGEWYRDPKYSSKRYGDITVKEFIPAPNAAGAGHPDTFFAVNREKSSATEANMALLTK